VDDDIGDRLGHRERDRVAIGDMAGRRRAHRPAGVRNRAGHGAEQIEGV
jgi:hypothetical protein